MSELLCGDCNFQSFSQWMNEPISQSINQSKINKSINQAFSDPFLDNHFLEIHCGYGDCDDDHKWWVGGQVWMLRQLFRHKLSVSAEKSVPHWRKVSHSRQNIRGKLWSHRQPPLFSLQIGGILQISWLPPSLPIADPSPLFSQLQIIVNWQGKATQGSHKCLDSDTNVIWCNIALQQWWWTTISHSVCHTRIHHQASW